MKIKNPWTDIPEQPDFVLPQDKPYIRSYNALCDEGAPARVNLLHTPEPRLGPIHAPVYVLLANPSYDASKPRGEGSRAARETELDGARREDLPHIGIAGNNAWWRSRVRQVIAATSVDRAARGICSVEFFPYRSLKFDHAHIRLPSQTYAFNMVQQALRDRRLILVMRVAHAWFGALPELAEQLGKTVFIANNRRSAYLTPANLGEVGFNRACEQIALRT